MTEKRKLEIRRSLFKLMRDTVPHIHDLDWAELLFEIAKRLIHQNNKPNTDAQITDDQLRVRIAKKLEWPEEVILPINDVNTLIKIFNAMWKNHRIRTFIHIDIDSEPSTIVHIVIREKDDRLIRDFTVRNKVSLIAMKEALCQLFEYLDCDAKTNKETK